MRAARKELLRAALEYRAAGLGVFPCKPGAKVPAIPAAHDRDDPARLTCRGECGRQGHGLYDATTVREVIEEWWRSIPYNIGIPTGPATFDVLDVDKKPEGTGFAALNKLIAAGLVSGASALVRTRSGGLHLYFAGTDQQCGRLPQHHLDFKALGGYVLVPPSWVDADDKGPAGAYELLDQRGGTARLDWDAVRRVLEPPRPIGNSDAARTGDGALTGARRAGILRYAAESNTKGGWASALFNAGCLYAKHGASLADALADIVEAAQPWNEHEAARAEMHVRNGWQRGGRALEAVER